MELAQVRERGDSELTRLGNEYDLNRQSLEDLEVSLLSCAHLHPWDLMLRGCEPSTVLVRLSFLNSIKVASASAQGCISLHEMCYVPASHLLMAVLWHKSMLHRISISLKCVSTHTSALA